MKTAQTEGLDEVYTAIILGHSSGKRNQHKVARA